MISLRNATTKSLVISLLLSSASMSIAVQTAAAETVANEHKAYVASQSARLALFDDGWYRPSATERFRPAYASRQPCLGSHIAKAYGGC